MGRAAPGGCGGLRDERHGFAALAAAHGTAGDDPVRPATVVAALGARRYGWVQPRLSPIARSALPPHVTVEYLEMTRNAIDFNRPGIPVVASLPSVHIAETYGRAHHGREPTVRAITAWAEEHHVPLVDLKAAVADEVFGGRGNPDGIHWSFEAHRAVAELMLKGLAEAGVTQRDSAT